METVNAFARTSHRYIDAYKHLDSEQFVATVNLTPPKQTKEGESFEEGGTYVQYLRVPRGVDTSKLRQALRDTLGYSSCKHEYDCCGCASTYVSTAMVSPRKMRVTLRVMFNY